MDRRKIAVEPPFFRGDHMSSVESSTDGAHWFETTEKLMGWEGIGDMDRFRVMPFLVPG